MDNLKLEIIFVTMPGLYPSTFGGPPLFMKDWVFMATGHSPKCFSTSAIAIGGSYRALGSRGNATRSFGYLWSQLFKYPFHASIGDLIFSIIRSLFACVSFCLRKTCMVSSSPHHHTLNGNISQFFSNPHGHAFSCRPKRCWSQIK